MKHGLQRLLRFHNRSLDLSSAIEVAVKTAGCRTAGATSLPPASDRLSSKVVERNQPTSVMKSVCAVVRIGEAGADGKKCGTDAELNNERQE
jgi:hypothetical protein